MHGSSQDVLPSTRLGTMATMGQSQFDVSSEYTTTQPLVYSLVQCSRTHCEMLP